MKSLFITILSFVLITLPSIGSFAESPEAKILNAEYARLYKMVQNLEPEFEVGGLMKGKKFGDVELLWMLAEDESDYDLIRLYWEREDGTSMDVSYFRATHIIKGENILRRFVGRMAGGWRNDTVHFETGEYYGSQGARQPYLEKEDRQILRTWKVKLIP